MSEVLRNAYGLHQAGRLAEAARAYDEIIIADPLQFDAHFLLGLIHLQSGRFLGAEQVLCEATALNPTSADALSARATALQQMGRNAEALLCLDRLLIFKPDHAVTWNNRENLLLALDRGNDAIANYDRALTLMPDYAEAWHNRAVAERRFYAEQIAYLPDSYQCNDLRRSVAERVPSRTEAGLPEKGFGFCCLNSSHKILPEIFDVWMRLLRNVENSVLWLYEEYSCAASNLRREAEARGVAPERIIFAERTDLPPHLARLTLAELVLDTLPYGAHTTASDALWVCVPVLTCIGQTFAGRVAASLLTAIGLPELITTSLEDYETRAHSLAKDSAELARLKARLVRNRDIPALFDTARITRDLEAAYREMWERQQRGEAPRSFTVERAMAPASS